MRYLFFFVLFLFSFSAVAQPDTYVRKRTKQPDFFIPEGSLKYQPDLSQPLPSRASGGAAIISREETPASAPTPVALKPAGAPQTTPAPQKPNTTASYNPNQAPPPSPYMNLDFSRMTRTPEYQKKYSDYMADLEVISKTGVAPFSRQVQDDLTQMNSDVRRKVK